MQQLKGAVNKVMVGNKLGGSDAKDDSPTIKVCVRVRCFIKEEVEGTRSGGQCKLCIEMPTETTVKMVHDEDEEMNREFEFDRCYWSHSKDHHLYADQETLQNELGNTLIQHALDGFNNCIFAYGQTGSGKSYSVLGGTGEQRGLLPRVVEGLFGQFSTLEADSTYKTLVAFVEIYNEQIRDLLAPKVEGEEKEKKLEVKQHPVLGTIIPGLTESPVTTAEEVLNLVDYGTKMRHVSATAMNATSSRSHCIFTFKTNLEKKGSAAIMSQTHLVDLAGSERAGRTKATGDRLKEGAAINQSLSTLARVISELAKKGKKKNPPFRDSKLTYILKESLCGNSKTVMMAAISPNFLDFEETLSTLKFAQSVKQVQTKAVQNAVNTSGVEAQLRKELDALKAQLAAYEDGGAPQNQKGVVADNDEEVAFLRKRLDEQKQLCDLYGRDWETLLKEEKARNRRRSNLTQDPRELLESLKPEEMEEGALSGDDDDDDDAQAFTYPLVVLGEPPEAIDPSKGRPSLAVPVRSILALVGPTAASMLETEPDAGKLAESLNVDMMQYASAAKEAETLLNDAGKGLQLQVLTVVNALDEEPKAALVVHASASSSSLPSSSWSFPSSGHSESKRGESSDWCSVEDLQSRLAWLKKHARKSKAGSGAELWAEAAAATSSAKLTQGGDAGEVARLTEDNRRLEDKLKEMENKLKDAEQELAQHRTTAELQEQGLPALSARQEKAKQVAKAIASSFETALSAIDTASMALKSVKPSKS
eukprot:TRINITY_DN24251_c0_g1_i1.p1 TRINITY_DN24251_c0_g1~~TRINITY_DN24251_c0_g1_i1.p1  ORF type:complete len:781 (-),score=210.65 TRINITY_DN24251_c0_g1_i1:31-2316(-)